MLYTWLGFSVPFNNNGLFGIVWKINKKYINFKIFQNCFITSVKKNIFNKIIKIRIKKLVWSLEIWVKENKTCFVALLGQSQGKKVTKMGGSHNILHYLFSLHWRCKPNFNFLPKEAAATQKDPLDWRLWQYLSLFLSLYGLFRSVSMLLLFIRQQIWKNYSHFIFKQ